MTTELTNLLPVSQVRALKREYFLRLATVSILLLSAIILIGAALLFPSYLYERQDADQESAQLAKLSTSQATTAEQQVQGEITQLGVKSASISALNKAPTASAVFRAVLAVPRPGISLNGFTYTPPTTGTTGAPGNMQLSGVADTRENLRSFDSALSALPFVTNADLPISDYAEESNIPFTITLTGSLNP